MNWFILSVVFFSITLSQAQVTDAEVGNGDGSLESAFAIKATEIVRTQIDGNLSERICAQFFDSESQKCDEITSQLLRIEEAVMSVKAFADTGSADGLTEQHIGATMTLSRLLFETDDVHGAAVEIFRLGTIQISLNESEQNNWVQVFKESF